MRAYLLKAAGTALKIEMGPSCVLGRLKPGTAFKKGQKAELRLRLSGKNSPRPAWTSGKTAAFEGIERIHKGAFQVCFDKDGMTAHCSYGGGMPPYFAVSLGVNYALQFFQEELNVFFLHAASMVIGGKAYLFVGPSGAGKSTISRLAEERGIKVIGEDTCVVKKKGKKFYVSAYPVSVFPAGQAGAWEVDSVLFLEKAKKNGMERILPIEAIRRAVPEVMCFSSKGMISPGVSERHSKYVFRSLSSMFENIRYGALSFSKDGEVFSCIG